VKMIAMRRATRDDLPALVALLADDALGSARESCTTPLPPCYDAAFDAIERDANQELMVATLEGRTVGTLQLTFTPSLSFRGGWRATVESVRVAAAERALGIGSQMLRWAIARANERGCRLVQLSSHKSRSDAIRFYQRLGFRATHEGMKLTLDAVPRQ
jgi:ribosomal protein S18 acetylase RimI-like enzyme